MDYWNAYCEAPHGPASFNVQLDVVVLVRVLVALARLPLGVVLRVVECQVPHGPAPVAAAPAGGAGPDPLGLALIMIRLLDLTSIFVRSRRVIT